MTVSMMNISCTTPWIDILGSGLVGDDKLKLKKSNGSYIAFTYEFISSYRIKIVNFIPAFSTDIYTLEYNGRELFTAALICPVQDLDGIYYIDASRSAMRDTYIEVIKKIPDPTIRTACIGE